MQGVGGSNPLAPILLWFSNSMMAAVCHKVAPSEARMLGCPFCPLRFSLPVCAAPFDPTAIAEYADEGRAAVTLVVKVLGELN